MHFTRVHEMQGQTLVRHDKLPQMHKVFLILPIMLSQINRTKTEI